MGRLVDPAQAQSLLRHVSETGANCPGCRHGPACLGGWQTPGLGCCQAWPAVLHPGGPALGARGPEPWGQICSPRPLYPLRSIGYGKGRVPASVCPFLFPTGQAQEMLQPEVSCGHPKARVPLTRQSLPDPGPMSGCLQVSHTWAWVGTLWVPLRAEMMMPLLTEPLLVLPLVPRHMLNCRPKDSSLPPTPF